MKKITVFETAAEFFDALNAQPGEKRALLPDNTGLHFLREGAGVNIFNADGPGSEEFAFASHVLPKGVVAEALRRLGVDATFE